MTARYPPGLGKDGRRLWREMTEEFDLGASDLILLEQAAAAADRVSELRTATVGEPAVIRTEPHGRMISNPAMSELRAERRSLVLLLKALGCLADAVDDDVVPPGADLAAVVDLDGRRGHAG